MENVLEINTNEAAVPKKPNSIRSAVSMLACIVTCTDAHIHTVHTNRLLDSGSLERLD